MQIGTHKSKFIKVDSSQCALIGESCASSAAGRADCICDSFGARGVPHSGCQKGKLIIRLTNKLTCSGDLMGWESIRVFPWEHDFNVNFSNILYEVNCPHSSRAIIV